MPEKPRYYVTTAISYPNGPPHIGHAYEVIATDAIARFMRLDGYDVFFLTGTDEHGQKIQQTATKEGITAQELVDRNVLRFRAMVERMNCSNDDFIRTTEDRHHRSSQAIWRADGEERRHLSRASTPAGTRCATRRTTPRTRRISTNTRFASPPRPGRRSNGWRRRAISSGSRPTRRSCSSSYERPDYVLPKERLNEVASFVRGGLQDLSVSRTTFDWGIRVPGNDKHIMYVWVDALTNYITAAGFPDTDSAKFKRYWPADLHVIGKDIVRFHAVYWPAFLMSAGIEVPRRIFSHGFLFNRGEKMSKSVGNVIDPFDLADAYGVDQFRYFFLREVPFGQDGNYSHEAIVNRINADLANDLGNLAQRSLTMIGKQLGGVLPKPGAFERRRQDDPRRGRRDDRHGARAHEDAAAPPGAQRRVGRGRRRQPLFRGRGALGAGQDRSGQAGHRALRHRRGDPSGRDPVPAVHAGLGRQAARPARRAGDRARISTMLGGDQRMAPGTALPPPAPVFPRYVEPEAAAKA